MPIRSSTILDRRNLLRTASALGIATTVGAAGASGLIGFDAVAQSATPTPAATAVSDAQRRRARLRAMLKARQAAPTGTHTAKPDHADVPYVDDGSPLHQLDIYLPRKQGSEQTGTPVAGSSSASIPVIVWIHGGGWIQGTKKGVGMPYLLGDGYAIVTINYRLLQDAMFPAQIVDANAALAWVWNHAGDYGFDRNRLVVAGSSAGGRSASLVGASANDDVAIFKADPAVKIAAVIDFFGGTDSTYDLNNNPDRKALIESERSPAEVEEMKTMADVRTFVDAGDPPMLIIHGDQDRTVPIFESEELVTAMKAAGAPVTFKVFPGRGHGQANYQDAAVQEVVRTFLTDTLGPL